MKFIHNSFFQYSQELNRHREWMKEKSLLGEPILLPHEVLCFCTGLTKSHFSHLMKKGDEKYSLETLRLETRAGYHCTGCVGDLKAFWEKELGRSGLVSPKVIPVRSRVGKNGGRTTYLGEYPIFWIQRLVDLQTEWQEREEFVEKFSFEITDAPIPFVDFQLVGDCDRKKAEHYFSHFVQFIEEKTKVKWYFTLIAS